MRKLSVESKVTLIYKIMRDNISTGLWHENDQFSSFDVARKYGIGRTTVNDAIKILEKKGFVEILPNVGFRIIAITTQGIKQYLEVRLAIELIVSKYLQMSEKPMEISHIKNRFRIAMASFDLGQHDVSLQGIEEYHLSIADMVESKSVRNLLAETEDLEYYILNQIMVKEPDCFVQILEIKQEYLDWLEIKDIAKSESALKRKKELIEDCIIDILAREESDE